MSTMFLRIFIILTITTIGISQTLLRLDVLRFRTSNYEPYIEIHYAVNPAYLENKNNKVHIQTELYKIQDMDTNLVFVKKFNLVSDKKDALWLHAERIKLTEGNYIVNVTATEIGASKQTKYGAKRQFSITKYEPPAFSDIIWVKNYKYTKTNPSNSPFFRSGVSYTPLVNEGIFYNTDTIAWIFEIYGLNEAFKDVVFIQLRLLDANNQKPIEGYIKNYRPLKPPKFVLIKNKFIVSSLPSQDYILEVRLLDKTQTVKAKYHYPFHLFNTIEYKPNSTYAELYDKYYGYDEEQLDKYIKALIYIALPSEWKIAQSLSTYEEKKSFFYAFWEARRESPDDPPDIAWRDYLARYNYANKHFKAVGREGWETDRGRVLLKYGVPNDIQRFLTEIDKHPYIIWTYNYLKNQSNVYFVFYDPDLSTNEFPLLHSTLQGEVYNANWRLQLLKSKFPNYNYDPEITSPDIFKDDKVLPVGSTGTNR